MDGLTERMRQAMLDGILDSAAHAVIAVDGGQRILFFSRGAERCFGFSSEEAAGQPLDLVLLQASGEAGHVDLRAAMAEENGGGSYRWEAVGRHKDGSEFPAEASILSLDGGEGTIGLMVRDITRRRQIEEARRESEARYQSIVAAMTEGIVLQDAEGRINACNASAERILGLTRDQMAGRTSLDPRWRAVHDDGSPFSGETHPAMVTLRTGEPQSNVIMGVHKPEGSLTWISINSQPLCRPGETVPYAVVASFADITERRVAEIALRQQEERYHRVFESVNDGLFINSMDGRIIEANLAACQMHGYTYEEMLRLNPPDIIHGDCRHLFAEFIETVMAGRQFHVQSVNLRKDGTQFDVDVRAVPFNYQGRPHALAIIRDITARREAERALREQEALLRNILELLPVGVWLLDRNGQILSGNEACRRIWGDLRHVGMNGYGEYKGWWARTGERVKPDEWAAVRAITRGETCLDELINIETFDGAHKTILNSAVPLRDAGGTITGAIVVNQDITEQMQAFQMLEQRVAERTRDLSVLLELSRSVASTLELKPLLSLILAQLSTVMDYTGAAIGIVEAGAVRLLDYVGPAPREQVLQQRYPLDRDSGYQRVVSGCTTVIIPDIWADTPWLRYLQTQAGEDITSLFDYAHSWMGIPLIVKGRVIGVLRLDHAEPDHFTQDHVRMALAFADQAATAIENARLYEQAQQLAAMGERQRLARELHDSISQALYAIALGIRTARIQLDRDPAQAAAPLDYALSLAEAAFADMRALIFELRPDSLQAEGLVTAIGRQIDVLRIRHGIAVQASLPDEPPLPLEVKQAVYRIVQEALHNVVKHARATEAEVLLALLEEGLVLEVADNGIGFDVTTTPLDRMGLRTMRERAEQLRGDFRVESRPEHGTRIRVWIPAGEESGAT